MYVIIANTQKPQFYNLVESDSWEVVVGVGGGILYDLSVIEIGIPGHTMQWLSSGFTLLV